MVLDLNLQASPFFPHTPVSQAVESPYGSSGAEQGAPSVPAALGAGCSTSYPSVCLAHPPSKTSSGRGLPTLDEVQECSQEQCCARSSCFGSAEFVTTELCPM